MAAICTHGDRVTVRNVFRFLTFIVSSARFARDDPFSGDKAIGCATGRLDNSCLFRDVTGTARTRPDAVSRKKRFRDESLATLSASGGHDGTILPVQATYPDGFAPNGMRYCSGNKKAGMIPAFSLMLSAAIRQWKSAWFRAVSVPVLSGKKFAGYRFRIWP